MFKKNLPVFKLVVDDDVEGMDYMGLVDIPAHGKAWKAFKQLPKKVERKIHFNEEKREVTGVAIATGLQIYRRDPDGFEYNVVFTKEETRKLIKKFAKNNFFNNVNIMHDMDQTVEEAYMIELYFINDEATNVPVEFKDQNILPGSVVMTYHIESDEAWEFIKENGAGFSIEGWFKEKEITLKKNQMKKVNVTIKNPKGFATIAEVDRWEIEVFEDTIEIGTQLHYI